VVAARKQHYQLLIADDDPAFRSVLKIILEPHFELFEACSGEEAIEIVEFQPVDIALLDMHMQVMTGLETLRILRSINSVAPCILITADPSEELRRNAAEADAYSVLRKPVSKTELVSTVCTALSDAYDDPDASAWLAG
jgi:CheY-like chemotaxis protein